MLLAAPAPESAPWWGVPLIAGLFAIFGVIATQTSTWFADRRRTRREDQRRWHSDRRQTYAAYIAELENAFRLVSIAWSEKSHDFDQTNETLRDARRRHQELNMLASDNTRKAALDLWNLLGVGYKALSDDNRTAEEHDKFIVQMHATTKKLLEVMRKELGVDP